MAHHAKLVMAAIIAAFSHAKAWAGYAYVSPPAGWGGSAASGWTFNTGAAANGERWVNGSVTTRVTTNVGGRMVTMPASMRMAANAGQFVLRNIAGRHPAGIAAMVIIPAVAAWLVDSGIRWNSETNQWEYKREGNPGGKVLMWHVTQFGQNKWVDDPDEWCKLSVPGGTVGGVVQDPAFAFSVVGTLVTCHQVSHPPGQPSYTTQVGGRYGQWMCPGNPPTAPVNDQCAPRPEVWEPGDFEPDILPRIKPLPDAVPNTAPSPGLPVPTGLPSINPDDQGNPQTRRYPSGDPVLVPGSDPAQWRQPYIDVVPRPTHTEPWRVDMQPGEKSQDDPDPMPDPVDIPASAPQTGSPRPATPSEEQKQLCDVYPDVVACQQLGGIGPEALEEKIVPVQIQPVGSGGAGSCPAPRTANIAGKSYSFEWTAICDFATGIKPIVVAVAWLTAILSFMGLSRRD